MKILVISDTHRNISNVIKIMKKLKNLDRIIHLGDNVSDIFDIISIFNTPIDYVAGNCDYYGENYKLEDIIEINSKKILITHGHLYKVKSGYEEISKIAKEKEVDIVLFGHTHRSFLGYYDDMLIMNPGSISLPRGDKYPTFGIIEIDEKGSIHPTLSQLKVF